MNNRKNKLNNKMNLLFVFCKIHTIYTHTHELSLKIIKILITLSFTLYFGSKQGLPSTQKKKQGLQSFWVNVPQWAFNGPNLVKDRTSLRQPLGPRVGFVIVRILTFRFFQILLSIFFLKFISFIEQNTCIQLFYKILMLKSHLGFFFFFHLSP